MMRYRLYGYTSHPPPFTLTSGTIRDSAGQAWTPERFEQSLLRIPAFPHFWFAWAAFYPETGLYAS